MAKGIPNKRYTPEFKKMVIETMLAEKLSYRETARRFDVSCDKRIKDWERIYLTEGAEGFTLERRGRGSKGRVRQLPKVVEEDLLAEVQRLRAENEYLKNLQALVWRESDARGKSPGSPKTKAKTCFVSPSRNRSTASCDVLLPAETHAKSRQICARKSRNCRHLPRKQRKIRLPTYYNGIA